VSKGSSCFSEWPTKGCALVTDDGDFCGRCVKRDPKRCHGAVHHQFGVGFYRCTNKHRPNDIFCGTHRRQFDREAARRRSLGIRR
jgi:hypothetical protein